jgi:hypothetical protein
MSDQRHRIRRQTFEVAVPGGDLEEVRRLQSELGQIQRRCITEILDRILSEVCDPGRVIRLGSVEVDLGSIRIERLEQDLVEKLGPALRAALTAQVRKEEARTPERREGRQAGSRLELLAFFAQTGTLPWWADSAAPRVLDEAVGFLVQYAAHPLASLVRSLARDRGKLLRIVLQCAEESLSALLGVLLTTSRPELAMASGERVALLRSLLRAGGSLPGQTAAAFRASMWTGILRAACFQSSPVSPGVRARGIAGMERAAYSEHTSSAYNTNASDPARPEDGPLIFWKDALAQIALDAGVTYTALILRLVQTADHPLLRSVARTLSGELREELMKRIPSKESRKTDSGLSTDPEAVSEVHRGDTEELLEFRSGGRSLIESGHTDTAALQTEIPVSSVAQAYGDESGSAAPISLRQPGGESTAASSSRLREEVRNLQAEARNADEEHRIHRPRPPRASHPLVLPSELSIDLEYADTEGVYVENAGLVLLWPFLGRLFERLDLIRAQDGGDTLFRDRAALHRAVGLLQHVATGETEPAEYQLPLAKVLCGMDPAEVFAFGDPVTAAEAEECDLLLAAVIANAPVLGEMSVDGFRGSFLIRKGLLGARDGTWLLRVERMTHDILIERLPWQPSWIKLPWLEAPIFVEW